MNKFFKGLATFAAASTLCVCPLNAAEDTKDAKNAEPSQMSVIWNAGLLGKSSVVLAITALIETGYIIADKAFGVFNN